MRSSSSSDHCSSSLHKFPLRRIEPFLKRCVRKLKEHLDSMRQHKLTISQLIENRSNAIQLGSEYAGTLDTVEKLIGTVEQFEQIHHQVEDNDIPAVNCQLAEALNGLVVVLFEFLQMRSDQRIGINALSPSQTAGEVELVPEHSEHQMTDNTNSSATRNTEMGATDRSESGAAASLIYSPPVEDDECWKTCHQLELKLLELNDVLQKFLKQIDNNMCNSSVVDDTELVSAPPNSCQSSSFHLSNINLKLFMAPIAGAVIGGAIAGPVGLVAGLKVGKIAAVSGGIIGLTGGTILKKKQQRDSDDQSANNPNHNEPNALQQTNPLNNVM